MVKLALVAVFSLLISACTSPVGFWPEPLFMSNFPPDGPPNYQQGMIDGCKTALGAVGSGAFGVAYNEIHYDVDKAITDNVYYKAWKDAYLYCKISHDKGPE